MRCLLLEAKGEGTDGHRHGGRRPCHIAHYDAADRRSAACMVVTLLYRRIQCVDSAQRRTGEEVYHAAGQASSPTTRRRRSTGLPL